MVDAAYNLLLNENSSKNNNNKNTTTNNNNNFNNSLAAALAATRIIFRCPSKCVWLFLSFVAAFSLFSIYFLTLSQRTGIDGIGGVGGKGGGQKYLMRMGIWEEKRNDDDDCNNSSGELNASQQFDPTKTGEGKWDCCGEPMAYTISVRTNKNLTENFVSGRRFNCALLPMLNKYKLADKFALLKEKISVKKPGSDVFTFVVGANEQFFPYLRTLLVMLKKQFGCNQKIIGYDLGGISEKKNMMDELEAVCRLEWRKFDWSTMPKEVHSPTAYAWKVAILAEIFAEFDTFVWLDTSIQIFDAKSLDPIFEAIEMGNISEAVFPAETGHNIQFATNLRTYTYLPMTTKWSQIGDQWDSNMYEANYIIMHRSEHTRKMLKWAFLCASTLQCIEPEGSELYCNAPRTEVGVCHRRDQSAMAILNVNLEYQRLLRSENSKKEGEKGTDGFLPHFHPEHPRKKSKHSVNRRVSLDDGKVDFKKSVACCSTS